MNQTPIPTHGDGSSTRPDIIVTGVVQPVRLDLGCGTNKRKPNPGEAPWIGVDSIDFPGVDVLADLANQPWPWQDGTVDEIYASHFVEHLRFNPEHPERIHFVNEAYRVLKRGGRVTIVVPHWCSPRHYGDYTHREPVSEFWFQYLNAEWRKVNAPHDTAYTCDFDSTQPGYSVNGNLVARAQDYQVYALMWFKQAADDMIATLFKNR